MATEVLKANEILLNDVRYKTKGSVKPVMVSSLPGRVVIGDPSQSDEPVADAWVISDQTEGLGIEHMDERVHSKRFWMSTCDTRFAGHILLPPLATESTPSAVGTGGGTITLRPNAAGTSTGLTIGGDTPAATNWESVDEAVADDGTTWVKASLTTATDTYNMAASGGSGIIDSVTIYIRCKAGTSGQATAAEALRTEGTTYYAAANSVTLDAAWHNYSNTWTVNPFTNQAWTWTQIDALEIGVRLYTNSQDVYCTQVYVIITYSSATFKRTIFANFNNELYASRGSKLDKLDSVLTTFTNIKGDFTDPITALIPSLASMLYVYLGTSGEYWYMTTGDSLTETNVAAAIHGVHWDEKLFKMDADGKIYHAVTPNSATPAWTATAELFKAGLPASHTNNLIVYRDAANTLIIHAAAKSGLWAYDHTNTKWVATELELAEHPNAGMGAVRWREGLYISAGLDVLKYVAGDPASIVAIGLSKDAGLPAEYNGEIVSLIKGYNDMFALVDASQVSGISYSGVYAYDGKGWRCVWTTSTANKPMHSGIVSSAHGYNLWFDHDDDIFYIPLERGLINPKKKSTSTYGSAGVHVTPWFDADWAGSKIALAVEAFCDGMSANETITIKYRTDYSDTDWDTGWTTLGDAIVADGLNTDEFASSLGTAFKAIQFRFDLARGSTTTNSPDVIYFKLVYLRQPKIEWGYRVDIDVTDDYNQTANETLLDSLRTAVAATTLVTFYYNDTQHFVYIKSIGGEEATGEDEGGTYSVLLIEPY